MDDAFVVARDAVDGYRHVLRETLSTARPPIVASGSRTVPLTYFMVTGWAALVAHGTAYLEELGAFGAPLTLVRYSLEADRGLAVGDRVHTDVEVINRARGPAGGSFVSFEHLTRAAGDEAIIARQRSTVLVQGLVTEERDRDAVRRSAVEKVGDPQRTTMTLSADLPGAFAAASGDLNPIHLDHEASRAAGFDELVVHGMCLLALTLECLPGETATATPASLSCQFGAPAHPGGELTISSWSATAGNGDPARAFNAATERSVALKNGLLVPRRDGRASTVAAHA